MGDRKSRFVAGFVGLANVLPVEMAPAAQGRWLLRLANDACCVCEDTSASRTTSGAAWLAIRPESIRIARLEAGPVGGDAWLRMTGVVKAAVFTGNLIDYFVDVAGCPEPIRVQSLPPAAATRGEDVHLSVAPENCILLED